MAVTGDPPDDGEAEAQAAPASGGAFLRRLRRRLSAPGIGSATLVVIGPDGKPAVALEHPDEDSVGLDGDLPVRSADEKAHGTDVFDLVERERMRIARDIHDGPAQILSNLVLKSEIIERLVAAGSEHTAGELAEFRTMARVALDETRRLIFDLRPMSLDDLGLAPALRRLTRQVGESFGGQVAFHVVGDERRVPPRVEAMLFRVAQEALANAIRHSAATHIDVAVRMGPKHVTVTVRDDGKGFDVRAAVARATRNERLGLVSMRERAAQHDGVVDIVSRPGAGTTLRVSAPL